MAVKKQHKPLVADSMSTKMLTLARNDTLTIADDLMKQERVRHLPVLDQDGALCGIVTPCLAVLKIGAPTLAVSESGKEVNH